MQGEGSRVRATLAGAALCTLIAIHPTAFAERPPPAGAERLAAAGALRPFFAALAGLDQHRARRPLRILQIGDSHTANDGFSGRLRERLQDRFGAAGRGWLPAGVPYGYFRPALVAVGESGWRHRRPGDAGASAQLGLDAVAAQAVEPRARMTLASGEPGGFDRVGVEFVARPRGTPLTLRIDNGPAQRIPTAARTLALKRFERLLPVSAREVELASPDGQGQEVLDWRSNGAAPGSSTRTMERSGQPCPC